MKTSVFDSLAEKILCLPIAGTICSEKVKKLLRTLHPSGQPEELCKDYYRKKISLLIKVFCVGIWLILMMIAEHTDEVLVDNNLLKRGAKGENSQQVILEIRSQKNEVAEITYDVPAQFYTKSEIAEHVERFSGECERLICGENENLQQVHTDLLLSESYDTYPMEFEWETSNYALINDDGSVNNEKLEEKETVELTACMVYEETIYEHTFTVCVIPPRLTAAQRWKKQVLEAISKADEQQRYTSTFRLPETVGQTEVTYVVPKSEDWKVLLALLPIVMFAVYLAKDRDLEKETEIQKRRMNLKYPEFVSKFELLLGAGLSVRNVFERLAGDKALGKELSEQLDLLVRDMKNGMSMKGALDRFGKRTENPLYMKFSALLIQNMKKGTDDLSEQLSKESSEAFLLRKQHARQLGEEAGTKLLFPMILMLAVVMAVLIIPAFLSFQL